MPNSLTEGSPAPGGERQRVTTEPQSGPINMGPKGTRVRGLSGVVFLAVGLIATGVLVWLGVGRWWRLLLFVPFWLGALGLLQARERT